MKTEQILERKANEMVVCHCLTTLNITPLIKVTLNIKIPLVYLLVPETGTNES